MATSSKPNRRSIDLKLRLIGSCSGLRKIKTSTREQEILRSGLFYSRSILSVPLKDCHPSPMSPLSDRGKIRDPPLQAVSIPLLVPLSKPQACLLSTNPKPPPCALSSTSRSSPRVWSSTGNPTLQATSKFLSMMSSWTATCWWFYPSPQSTPSTTPTVTSDSWVTLNLSWMKNWSMASANDLLRSQWVARHWSIRRELSSWLNSIWAIGDSVESIIVCWRLWCRGLRRWV